MKQAAPDRNGDSPFQMRGVIEGFYGRPWTQTQRLDLLPFLAATGFNTFVYAPKDDPLVRRDWRVPYSGEALAKLTALVDASASLEIDFISCLSPGLSIEYSSDKDLAHLNAKFWSLSELGVTSFGLLLDDIPDLLQHERDLNAFPDLVAAHVHLIGRVFAALPPGSQLTVCPTQYWGYGDEEYISRLGKGLDPRIDIFWTGRAICSPALDLWDAATVARSAQRPVTFWDNYPVNDVAMTHELHVGPYRNRDPHLFRFSRGIVANAMELYESSKVALATIGDYLTDPSGYDPETSWERAIALVAGPDDARAYRLFADNVRSSCLAETDAPLVTRALERFTFIMAKKPALAESELMGVVAQMRGADAQLTRGTGNPGLLSEAEPWLKKFRSGIRAMELIAKLPAAPNPSQHVALLREVLAEVRSSNERVFGDVLVMTLEGLISDVVNPPEPPNPVHDPTAKDT